MGEVSEEVKGEIEQILHERGVKAGCPRCGAREFAVIVEGYVAVFLQPTDPKVASVQGANIPAVALVCRNCGFISQHALGVLGLMPKRQAKKE
jgi:hypothetical protein